MWPISKPCQKKHYLGIRDIFGARWCAWNKESKVSANIAEFCDSTRFGLFLRHDKLYFSCSTPILFSICRIYQTQLNKQWKKFHEELNKKTDFPGPGQPADQYFYFYRISSFKVYAYDFSGESGDKYGQ